MPEEMNLSCKTCLNRATLVCQGCTSIKSPSGKQTRPTHYMGDGATPTDGLSPGDLGAILLVRVQLGKPLPLSLVLRYNEQAAHTEA